MRSESVLIRRAVAGLRKAAGAFTLPLTVVFLMLGMAAAQSSTAAPDLTRQPTLYVVPYAHLDTQWRWEYPTVIREYLPKTLHDNFALFEKYPHYVFNFSGANRYRMMREYYPADYARLKQYVAAGRWFPAGSSMEENDVNNPSAESIMRQVLYGTHYFRRDFGKTSAEYMLPDCFGFPASLPSILAHMGLKGFSTQKLSWHSGTPVGGPGSPQDTPAGIPFNVGFWEGPDGRGVVAALNATDYTSDVTEDLTTSLVWYKRVHAVGKSSGLFVDFRYYGTGDTGGAPREDSVKLMEAILTKSDSVIPPARVGEGPTTVRQTEADQMFLDIGPEQAARLPRYTGDLELTEHSAGSLTSQAYQKRWNRKNELLADAAERSSVAAAWLGARPYPLQRLNDAWTLVTGGQFHDIIPGTATPRAFEYSWNDDVIAMNQFAGVLTSAAGAIASGLDTQVKGAAIVVYNPLNIAREDVVEATVAFPGGVPPAVQVVGPNGVEVSAQLAGADNGGTKVLFLADVPAVSYAVYDIQAAKAPSPGSTLKVTESSLENTRYRIRLDQNGDVASIFDKTLGKELLAAPARLAFKTDRPVDWPAWNMDWTDQQQPPRAYVQGPAKIRIVENGPVRVAIEVEREAEGSRFVQTIRLSADEAGNRVEFANSIDWKTPASNLKAIFPLTAYNPLATYNWDVGTIQRGNDEAKRFEVASHQWVDLTDKTGSYGVTVLTDCKNGSDKPDDNTLRLTLIRTPGIGTGNGRDYSDQTTQDWGHHEILYGLVGHTGDWRQEHTDWEAQRLNQPLIAFASSKHPGVLGKTFSLLHLNNDRVRVLALKQAEDSDEVILRAVELDGKPQTGVHFVFAAPIADAREVNGQEQPLGPATVEKGELVANFGPYQPRTFAVKLAEPRARLSAPHSQAVTLPYDLTVASRDGAKSAAAFDAARRSLPAEMLPHEIAYDGIQFSLASVGNGKPDAVVAHGQTIALPAGKFNRLYLLAASADGDQKATFRVGDSAVDLTIQDWGGFIGQWDTRTWNKREVTLPPRPGAPAGARPRVRTVLDYTGVMPGFIKRAPLAWFASHHHNADGTNEPYAYSYLFAYSIAVPAKSKTVTLPDNDKIRILAITLAEEGEPVSPAQPLYDTLENPQPVDYGVFFRPAANPAQAGESR